VGKWQLRLLAPAARDIHARVGDPAILSTTAVHDGLRETVFRRDNVAQLQVDEHLPPAEYLKFQVELSEFNDWKDVAAWAARLFASAMQPSPAVDEQVDTLKAQAADRDALLRATLDFVQRDIRYFGTESGIASHQPATADTVLRQRFGDCKDKVALLAELLTRLGFDATPVIVSANYQDATRQRLPSPLAFDHAIVRVTIDGKPVFLDATRSQQTGRIATRESLDLGVGLLAQDATSELTALPSSRDQVHVETVDTFAFPQLAKEGTLTSVTILRGDTAEWFRTTFASQPRSEIEKGITGDSVRAYPSLVATGPVDFETITEDNSVHITSHYRTGDFWTMPEQRGLVGRFVLSSLVAPLRMQDQATRTQPYRLPRGRYLHKAVFEFGEPFPGAPQDVHFDEANDFFELHTHSVAQSPREEVDGELDMLADAVPAADWPAHREKVNKIAPHLGGGIAMSPYSVAQFDTLRSQGEALLTKLRKGDIKTVTQVQISAHLKLLADERQLDSDRLPPTLRAQVLVDKGEQLDHLGQLQPASEAFNAAIALDPKNVSAHEALGINAILRGDDSQALKETAEALRLAPSMKTQLDITRGHAHYLGGDANAARDDFKAALQSRAEVERSYAAIWLYLATRRMGDDGVQAVKAFEPTGTHPDWPFSVLQLMEGRIEFDAALVASRENGQRSPGRECELYFYAGEKALAEGDQNTARKYLRMSVATGVTEFNEYGAARRELARLGDR
jgi:lipoprotein NlpI